MTLERLKARRRRPAQNRLLRSQESRSQALPQSFLRRVTVDSTRHRYSLSHRVGVGENQPNLHERNSHPVAPLCFSLALLSQLKDTNLTDRVRSALLWRVVISS